jgi:hypothetical protein
MKGYATSWTPARQAEASVARRVRVLAAQKAEAAATQSGIASGGAGGASLTARYVGYYASIPP